jgi:hypothetical protein
MSCEKITLRKPLKQELGSALGTAQAQAQAQPLPKLLSLATHPPYTIITFYTPDTGC